MAFAPPLPFAAGIVLRIRSKPAWSWGTRDVRKRCERGSGGVALASSRGSEDVRDALQYSEVHKNRVRVARARRARLRDLGDARLVSAESAKWKESADRRQRNTFPREPGIYLSASAPNELRTRRTCTRASLMVQGPANRGFSTPRARRSELRVRPRPSKSWRPGFAFPSFSRFSWFDAQFDWSGSTSKCDRSASEPFRGTPTQESTVCGAKRRLIFSPAKKSPLSARCELGGHSTEF